MRLYLRLENSPQPSSIVKGLGEYDTVRAPGGGSVKGITPTN